MIYRASKTDLFQMIAVRKLLLCIGALLLMQGASHAQQPVRDSALVDALLVYNNQADSGYRILLQEEGAELPERSIGIPMWLVHFDWTQAEAGALVAATAAYVTPDVRHKPRERLDREARFEQLLRALESCPAALSAVIQALDRYPQGSGLANVLREVRTKRVEYAVAPDRYCTNPIEKGK
jgi:hypothetical protein